MTQLNGIFRNEIVIIGNVSYHYITLKCRKHKSREVPHQFHRTNDIQHIFLFTIRNEYENSLFIIITY